MALKLMPGRARLRAPAFFAALILAFGLTAPALAQSPTRTRLLSSPNPSAVGEAVTLTAEVDGFGGGAPTGAASFFTGTTALGAAPLQAPGAGQATIAAGLRHTCALTPAGLKCWGYNFNGELGDGTQFTSLTPVPVSGLTKDVVAVTAGLEHSCALTLAGAVYCWGDNESGQLGDGTAAPSRLTPVPVSGLTSGVVAIAAGGSHTCALLRSGVAKCWGANGSGQIGIGIATGRPRRTPALVAGLPSGVVAITGGYSHTCALTGGGAVLCWGSNRSGQLGDGTIVAKYTPIPVSGLSSGVAAISGGGSHTCALTAARAAKCWGSNSSGQLGDGTTTERRVPVDVNGLSSGVAAITAGGDSTCALTAAGAAKCWGRNDQGQLGDGTTSPRPTPIAVSGLSSSVAAILAGLGHTCALTSAGEAKCWGENRHGQLGDGTIGNARLTPAVVKGLASGVVAIGAGNHFTCASTSGAGAKCWGDNYFGQLGDGTTLRRRVPVDVSGLATGITEIAGGDSHVCALTAAGGVKCWGGNGKGQLGDGTRFERHTPVDVAGLSSGVVAIGAGVAHSCALTAAGAVKCWGWNEYGQLGDGSATDRLTPVDVSGLASGVTAVAVGGWHSCAVTSAGPAKCWGSNYRGQLGDGTTTDRLTPVLVSGPSAFAGIAAAMYHTCAWTRAGGAKCWGENYFGQLGDGTTTLTRLTPVNVSGLASGVVAIAVGGGHTCALIGDGAKCWGVNSTGQLGDGTINQRLTPVDVSGLTSGVVAIAANGHSCALTSDGAQKCWGWNGYGELGVATPTFRAEPVTTKHFLGLVRSAARLSRSNLGVGVHTLKATYPGDLLHRASSGRRLHAVE